MFVSCECCVLSGRGLCVGLITRPESPTNCDVSEYDHASSTMRRPWPTGSCCAMVKKNSYFDSEHLDWNDNWNDNDRRRKETLWQILPSTTVSAAFLHVLASVSERSMVNHGQKYLPKYKWTTFQETFSSSSFPVPSIKFLGACNMPNKQHLVHYSRMLNIFIRQSDLWLRMLNEILFCK
jgi:hypothetical protein